MMTKLVEKVSVLVKEEYEFASSIYGTKHNSPHEAAAVIFEEMQESHWDEIKKNTNNEELNGVLKNMRESAILCACEMIQVAAMAHKAMKGYIIDDVPVPYEPIFPMKESTDENGYLEEITNEREGIDV